MENWKEIFASFGLWSLVEDISDDGDGEGDNLQLTKDGELFVSEIQQELDKVREEWTEELRQAFYDTFYKSGELWFDYIFEDGDTEAEQNAKEVVEEYWKEIISKLTTK